MAVTQSFARPSATVPGPSAPAAPQSGGGLWETFTGPGFDFCDPIHGLPSIGDMETWYVNGPYGIWGLYLGGASNHGICGALTSDYVKQLAQEGWRFIPTWVGPQAPCTSFPHRMSSDPATAKGQGVTEADLAIAVAKNLGLTLADGSGTMITYDVEYYLEPQGQTSCLQAVQAFISGWAGELRANGNMAGVYGATCGERLSALANIPNIPDQIWIAHWVSSGYDPNASVMDGGLCGLDDSLWSNHQRLRQYAGGHDETWGNVTFNIDSDVIDATVAQVPVNCAPVFGQVGLFVDWYFGGQCLDHNIGRYPTRASLALPPNSISSIRVGPNMEITVCQGEFFAPPCQTFTADAANLAVQPVGNDTISSAIISTTLVLTNTLYLPVVPLDTNPSRLSR
jgi:hypothetical protein